MPEEKTDIEQLLADIKKLREELRYKEELLREKLSKNTKTTVYNDHFTPDEIVQCSRQIIMREMGLQGQIALKQSKILIVGAGGLGCPAALYLARSGVGEITLIDYDDVELSNLHRQILYTELDIGKSKVQAAQNILESVGSVEIIPLQLHANSESIKKIVAENKFNVIIDGSDNVATRYLLNDVSVINNIPLVSGSALQIEGQLTVFHYNGGPCYRCLFPVPPPPETVTSCGDGGVLGPIPGVIGVLQALETIKILTNNPGVLSSRLLLFDGSNTMFRSIKLRPRNPNCEVCGDKPTITELIDYEEFCGAKSHDKVVNIDVLSQDEHIDVKELQNVKKDTLVLDVRPQIEYEMCKLPNTVNFPFSKLETDDWIMDIKELLNESCIDLQKVYVLCRRGNDSQRAITHFKNKLKDVPARFFNVKGGLHAYSKTVDSKFPIY